MRRLATEHGLSDDLLRFEADFAHLLGRPESRADAPPVSPQPGAHPSAAKGSESMLTATQQATLAALPVKLAPRVRALMLKGVDRAARLRIARGENPFPEGASSWLRLAGERLLAEQSLGKAQLRALYLSAMPWTDATAASHVSATVAILPALGIARLDNERLTLIRD